MSTKKPVQMTKEERRDAALKIAIKFAKKIGARRVSIAMVAAEQKVTPPLLFHIFESHAKFVAAIVKTAKAQGVTLAAPAPTVLELRAQKRKAPVVTPPKKPAAKKVAVLLKPKVVVPPVPAPRKALTEAQKKAKAAADKARRSAAVTSTPAQKFASLPKPFEAAMQQVGK